MPGPLSDRIAGHILYRLLVPMEWCGVAERLEGQVRNRRRRALIGPKHRAFLDHSFKQVIHLTITKGENIVNYELFMCQLALYSQAARPEAPWQKYECGAGGLERA